MKQGCICSAKPQTLTAFVLEYCFALLYHHLNLEIPLSAATFFKNWISLPAEIFTYSVFMETFAYLQYSYCPRHKFKKLI